MFITELIFALVIAFILSLIFSLGFRGHGWGIGFLLFFVILFLVTWAGGIWITPFGPLWWGVPWLSFLFVGILIALIMAALIPDNRKGGAAKVPAQEAQEKAEAIIALDIFFWVLIIVLIGVLVAGYAVR